MTGMGLALAVAAAGGVGAVCRMVLDGLVKAHSRTPYPLGTLAINVSGSFLLGLVTALASVITGPVALIVGTGLLGGYTTFSTASFEAVALARESRWRAALAHTVGMLLLGLAAAALGLWLGAVLV